MPGTVLPDDHVAWIVQVTRYSVVYRLLIGKKISDYDQFFELLMETGGFNLESLLTDFESATINSVDSLFPNVNRQGHVTYRIIITLISFSIILGCLFHFGQHIWYEVPNQRLKQKYHENKPFNSHVRKLVTLAFVPVLDSIQTFDLHAVDFDDDADDLLGYFENT